MERLISFEGAVVEQQALLDGTRELTIDAEETGSTVAPPSTLTLSLRLPKEGSPREGDLSLTGPDSGDLFATLAGGGSESTIDEETDDEIVRLELRFRIESGEGGYAGDSETVQVSAILAGDDVRLTVRIVTPGDQDSAGL